MEHLNYGRKINPVQVLTVDTGAWQDPMAESVYVYVYEICYDCTTRSNHIDGARYETINLISCKTLNSKRWFSLLKMVAWLPVGINSVTVVKFNNNMCNISVRIGTHGLYKWCSYSYLLKWLYFLNGAMNDLLLAFNPIKFSWAFPVS